MNSPLLIVIPLTVETAPQAERMVDWCFYLNGGKPKGFCLLVAASDVHGEMCTKIAISSEVAFESVELIVAPESQSASSTMLMNHLFKFAGEYIMRHFRCPWLFLEPWCVPLKPDWQEHLMLAYNSQPKRYMGGHLQYAPAEGENPAKLCLARQSVYPSDAINDIGPHCSMPAPFHFVSAPIILSKSSKSRLVQELHYTGDNSKIRPDACVLNGDKTGKLIEHLQSTLKPSEVAVRIPINGDKPKLSVADRMAKARAARNKVGAVQMARL